MFSNEDVARFINQHFEAVWESVRPVPMVQINFGGGTVVTRTLHGNIATYLCDAQGRVLDILPGIYTPAGYLQNLHQFELLARYIPQWRQSREMRLHNYHLLQAEALKKNQLPALLVENRDVGKTVIENTVKLVLASNVKGQAAGKAGTQETSSDSLKLDSPRDPVKTIAIERPVESVLASAVKGRAAGKAGTQETSRDNLKLDSPADLANWKLLAEDTRINETARRLQIHEMLAAQANVRPETVTKWLYREVLHADLDDPYLGLGNVLFANYPFKDTVQ